MGQVYARVGGCLAYSTANGGKVYAVTLGTTTASILATNGLRQSLIFHNTGSATAYVAPMTTANGSPLSPSLSALAGCFQLPAGATMIFRGECQTAWQAFSASAGNPLTIMESNV
jgi:hypothetical protein